LIPSCTSDSVNRCCGVMDGDVNIAAPDLTWRFTTKSFAVGAEMILKRT
jgi:hypothetical protein